MIDMSRIDMTWPEADRLLVAVLAIILVSVLGLIAGRPQSNSRPILWRIMDRALGRMGDRLNKRERRRAALIWRGVFVTAVSTCVCTLCVFLAQKAGQFFSYELFIDIFVLCTLLTTGRLWMQMIRLHQALKKEIAPQKTEIFEGISRTARRRFSASDPHDITRAALFLLADGFVSGMAAPVFWYLIGGLPFAMLTSVIAVLVWRFGRDGYADTGFAAVPIFLHRAAQFIPAVLAALLLSLAAIFSPGIKTLKTLKGRSGARGMRCAVILAWGMNITLGGPGRDINGQALPTPWIGPEDSTARVRPSHLRYGLWWIITAHLLFLALLCTLYLLRAG